VPISFKFDAPNFDFRSLAHHEGDFNVGRRERSNFRSHRGELAPMLGFELPDDDLGMLHLGRVILRLGRKADFLRLEAFQNVAFRDGVDPRVRDRLDPRPFLHVNVNDPAFRGSFSLETDVLEKAGVPQGVEIPLDRALIVDVPWLGEDVGADHIRRNGTVPVDLDFGNHVRLLSEDRGRCQQEPETNQRAG